AVKNAKTPYFDSLWKNYSHTLLKTCGEFVGLKYGQFGNSEVGHLNLGAGRIVKQNSTKISDSIKSGEFFENKKLINMIENLKKHHAKLHVFGLCSTGGVHSELDHLFSILRLCKNQNFFDVFIHFVSDGRDTDTKSGKKFLSKLQNFARKLGVGKVISVSGRFYAMDREKNFDRTERFLKVLTSYESDNKFEKIDDVFDYFYNKNVTDEFVEPSILQGKNFSVQKNDAILCFNYRSDRARQIFEKLIECGFKNLYSFVCYDQKFEKKVKVVFEEDSGKNCLSEVLSKHKKTQLRISETTKYAHVTYFFNLLNEKPFCGEKRIIIEGDKINNFAEKPLMKTKEITETIIRETDKQKFDFVLVNFPNADMLGHTGNYEKTIESLQFLDKNLKVLVENLRKKGYVVLITADHGNADIMRYPNGEVCTTHTTSDAPFIVVDEQKYNLSSGGKLASVSPTILDIMHIKPPKEFSEKSLIESR
ncbi:MAG: 2,3-bisphosphoglycerate-independent phosphoglycerate mutase, partial [Christensenellales bacterium]